MSKEPPAAKTFIVMVYSPPTIELDEDGKLIRSVVTEPRITEVTADENGLPRGLDYTPHHVLERHCGERPEIFPRYKGFVSHIGFSPFRTKVTRR